ncbi:2-phospho-L-lactate transferase [Pseudomaricurvus alkylphenolicus]|uniref:2-phospho-L-lactate transferase n=1 Tax=Pseudomaricurvus alkylphenolicus TaxID=1306991 RepID=UPI001421B9AF|nr:2-phospho-L-lactate transferase [Pseudomaricurvus alkylphenolicus]NIB38686.1 2-phospho-L-lactate transferase [Pseudomaricurvus alkylphenolicus]
MNTKKHKVLAISGGVGGAKLALGLYKLLPPQQLTIVTNTADDFEHLGLSISPDLDTLMYTLAGRNNQAQGWGLAGESWQTMAMLKDYGAEDWFQLGDKDIATHLVRSQLLRQGKSLAEVTTHLCRKLGIETTVLPMTDDPVRTRIQTADGELAFQHYFVREQCRPAVTGYRFDGIDSAKAHPDILQQLADEALSAIIICPSNPFVSVSPFLQLEGVRDALKASRAPVIAVSPIVAGMAIKGPAAKMMQELNMPNSAQAVAQFYGDLLDGFVIDESDADQADAIRALGTAVDVAPTVMRSLEDRIGLAEIVLQFSNLLES